jgi:hypothetical protein
MLSLTFSTRKAPAAVREELGNVFGPGGLGLRGDTSGEMTAFTGGGGFVTAVIRRVHGRTVIDMRTQEFEDSVERFAREEGESIAGSPAAPERAP